jgi:hypothetical protein
MAFKHDFFNRGARYTNDDLHDLLSHLIHRVLFW